MGDDRFMGRYRIPSARLAGWDYGSHGLYFVTICTLHRYHYFGEIDSKDGSWVPTDIGAIAHHCWMQIPEHYPFMELDEFVVMLNHVHGILFIKKDNEIREWVPNQFGPQRGNLPDVLRGFKSTVSRQAKKASLDFGWQSRYHDHIIRNEKELENIRAYIANNPHSWINDVHNINK